MRQDFISLERNEKASTDYPSIFDILEQDLINYILFLDEPELPESLSPHSPFAKAFMYTKFPLRKLDLNKRIFSLRCSFMIHSQAFSGLPKIFQNRLLHELKSILKTDSKTKDEKFAYLSRREKIHSSNSRNNFRSLLNEKGHPFGCPFNKIEKSRIYFFATSAPAFFHPEMPADKCLTFLYPSLAAASAPLL